MNRTRTSGVNHTTVSSGPAVGIERCIPLRLFQTQPHTDSWPGCSPGICQVKWDTSVQFIWGWTSGWLIQAWVGMAGGRGRRPNRAGLAW